MGMNTSAKNLIVLDAATKTISQVC